MASHRSTDPALDQLMLRSALLFWQLPFAVFTSWWALASGSLSSAAHARCDAHEQLVVPEPLEATGEHALFA